jgi:hypothetical protein
MAPGTMKNDWSEMERDRKSCEPDFWQNVFRAEADYLLRHLRDGQTVLSVGCGPAVVESFLSRRGVNGTTLFESREPASAALFVIHGARKQTSP